MKLFFIIGNASELTLGADWVWEEICGRFGAHANDPDIKITR